MLRNNHLSNTFCWGSYYKSTVCLGKTLSNCRLPRWISRAAIIIYWKSSMKKVKTLLNGCLSNQHRKEFLCSCLLKSGITKNCFWLCVVVSCMSHASGKVLPRLVKFYWQIFYKCRFSNTSRQLLLKLPRNSQSFLIQSQVAEYQHVSYRFFFKLFMCVIRELWCYCSL